MTEYLVIQLGEQADSPVSWIVVDDRGTRRGQPGSGSLADAAREVRERPVIALVPAAEVSNFSVNLPAKGARLLAALPFALEDKVADDVEDLHFCAGERRENGAMPVAVVARRVLDEWLERLSSAGIRPQRVLAESAGIAHTPNTMSLLVATDKIMFNDGEETSFAISGMSPGEVVAAAGIFDDEEKAGARHLLVYCDAVLNERFEKDWALLRHELSSVDVNLLPDGVLPKLAVTVASGAGINLLQGAYGPKTELLTAFKPWKYAAVFLIALGLVGLLGKGADYYRLSAEQDLLQQQFVEEYRAIRPGDTRDIVNPKPIIDDLRGVVGGASSGPKVFLPSLMLLASAIRENDTANVEAISYRAGVIDVRLNAPDIATLDKIVQAVNSSGRFAATLQSADNIGERVNSRIQIREAGA